MNIYELEDRPDQSGSWFDQDSKQLFIFVLISNDYYVPIMKLFVKYNIQFQEK